MECGMEDSDRTADIPDWQLRAKNCQTATTLHQSFTIEAEERPSTHPHPTLARSVRLP
jgi:hypothetical protein